VSAIVVLCTCPDEAVADRIAGSLVEERLAACVNRIPGIVSTYRWKGEIHRDCECLLLIKTTMERFNAMRERIVALHPYDVPEIVALAIEAGSAAYLDWIESSVRA
jgi:periplasmic divalent cation tolerance protein